MSLCHLWPARWIFVCLWMHRFKIVWIGRRYESCCSLMPHFVLFGFELTYFDCRFQKKVKHDGFVCIWNVWVGMSKKKSLPSAAPLQVEQSKLAQLWWWLWHLYPATRDTTLLHNIMMCAVCMLGVPRFLGELFLSNISCMPGLCIKALCSGTLSTAVGYHPITWIESLTSSTNDWLTSSTSPSELILKTGIDVTDWALFQCYLGHKRSTDKFTASKREPITELQAHMNVALMTSNPEHFDAIKKWFQEGEFSEPTFWWTESDLLGQSMKSIIDVGNDRDGIPSSRVPVGLPVHNQNGRHGSYLDGYIMLLQKGTHHCKAFPLLQS
jgi:hypothetical protein